MFLDLFENISKVNKELSSISLNADPIFSFLSPSSQVCYSAKTNQQLGSCMRELWFDKNNYLKTNERSLDHVKMSAYIGNKWEDWFVDNLKLLPNTFITTQVLVTYPQNFVKGFVDVLIKNTITNNFELIEVKTYDGGSYFSSEIYGNEYKKPTPKIKHLLQAFRYLLIFKDKVDAINLVYIDRSCTSWFRNKQFRITLETFSGEVYPKIEVMHQGSFITYINSEVTESSMLQSEEKLLTAIKTNAIPEKDFKATYTSQEIEDKYAKGLIYKSSYTKYQNDKNVNLGDFQCEYCPFSKGTCEKYGT